MSESQVELHAIVHGYVQGVGFRATTCDYAERLGLTGTVRNCRDGSVEIYAQGEQGRLEKLLQQLKGNFQIQRIEINYSSPVKTYSGFTINSFYHE